MAFVLLVVAVSGVFVVQWASAPGGRKLPVPLRDQLAARVVDALEHDPTFRTEVTREPGPWPVCVASVFGLAPDGADSMDEVRTIYTWVDCAWLGPADIASGRAQFDISQLFALSMPIALRLGPPVAYQAPDDGEKYPDSITRVFPKPLQAAAFSHPDPSARTALQERIVQVIGSPSPSHS